MTAAVQEVPALSSFAENARFYNEGPFGRRYPDSRFLIGERGCYATWMPGRNFQNRSRLYGAYPRDFLARMWSVFPGAMRVLHLFSGSLTEEQLVEDWIAGRGLMEAAEGLGMIREAASAIYRVRTPLQLRYDNGRHPLATVPDVAGNAEELVPTLMRAGSYESLFDVVYADPPYRLLDQRTYWKQSMLALGECLRCHFPGAAHRPIYFKHEHGGRMLCHLAGQREPIKAWEMDHPGYVRFVPLKKALVIDQARMALKIGGHLVWLDESRPFYSNKVWEFQAAVTIFRSTGHRVRAATILRRRA